MRHACMGQGLKQARDSWRCYNRHDWADSADLSLALLTYQRPLQQSPILFPSIALQDCPDLSGTVTGCCTSASASDSRRCDDSHNKAPSMRAALLLLTLCSLAAAYAIAPTALDVAQTQDVSPVDPVGEHCRSQLDSAMIGSVSVSLHCHGDTEMCALYGTSQILQRS